MENLMRKLFEGQSTGKEESARLNKPAWIPAVDAWETTDGYHLLFDLPGIAKDEISIEVEGDQLVIKGERKLNEDIKYLRKETPYGSFFRAFTLEVPVEQEKIKATFKNGVLEIILPKKEEVKPKQISIEIAEE
jgi:HSP20 family protein